MAESTDTTPKKRWVPAFLRSLAEDSNVSGACRAAGIERSTAYDERHANPVFAAEWEYALELGTGAMEDEARRRALNGSDTLLIFMLKAHKPGTYRETTRTVNVNITPEQAAQMSDAEIDALLEKEGLL